MKPIHNSISSIKPIKIPISSSPVTHTTILTSIPNSIHNILPYKIEISKSAFNIKIRTTILTNTIKKIILKIFPIKIINQTKIIQSIASNTIIYHETTIQTCITTSSFITDYCRLVYTKSALFFNTFYILSNINIILLDNNNI